jgi:hypothetical protein
LWAGEPDRGHSAREDREKVGLSMRVSPPMGFSPMRVRATAELKGDLLPPEEALLYCASVEWDWGDGTRSEAAADCEPFEPGKTEIKRRFAAEHTYNYSGRFRILLRLKRNNRVLLGSNSSVQVRPGAREWTGYH